MCVRIYTVVCISMPPSACIRAPPPSPCSAHSTHGVTFEPFDLQIKVNDISEVGVNSDFGKTFTTVSIQTEVKAADGISALVNNGYVFVWVWVWMSMCDMHFYMCVCDMCWCV